MALRDAGEGVLGDPKRLLSYLYDVAGPTNPGVMALDRQLDERLLAQLSVALAPPGAPSLRTARERVRRLLSDERGLDAGVADALADALAGIADRSMGRTEYGEEMHGLVQHG